ncbi:MAG: M16 family metallopeptidase [Saprospiraceae bacterium]
MKNFLIFTFLIFSSSLFAQTKMIEKVEKKGDKIVIPYEKHVLSNGLTLVIHEDHSDPLVHVDVTYHVGSAREELKKSGFAHFFEHMMFQGSENVADEEHFKTVTEAGGTLNGTTNRDRTNYFETVPSNQLEKMLWLEADRMGFFLDAVTQQKFEIQRETVKNEKGQNVDNRPYGAYRELQAEALYPYGHPYSWLTIGKLEDLDRVNVEDLKKFFLRWYGPNNATLTVGGDVNPKDVIKMVEKYFGNIPTGPAVKNMKLEKPTLKENRYVSYVDKNIRFPAVIFTYPTVPRFHKDEAPLDCLAEILGTGKSSYFYKNFVKTQKAIQASSFNPASELSGEFSMFILPFPGQSLEVFESQVLQILEDFEKAGVTDADIEKFKADTESNMINSLASVSGKVSQLASFQTFKGTPNGIGAELDRYMAITKDDVMRVFKKYIKDQPYVLVSVLASEEEKPAKADNFKFSAEGKKNPFPTTDYSKMVYNKATGDTFDRSKKPGLGANPVVKVPEFWKSTFKNGIKVIGTKSDEIPTVSLQLTINGGHKLDAMDKSKSGLASLTGSMMNEATKNYTSEEIQEELRKLGSSVSIGAGRSSTTMFVSSLKKNLPATLKLAEEILMNPLFAEEDFERLKKQQLEGIKSSRKDPSTTASQVYNRLLYGKDHIYAIPTSGDEGSVVNITLDDVKSFYKKYYSPSVSELVVVGDISEKEVMPQLQFLKDWKAKSVKIPSAEVKEKKEKTKIYIVDKTDAPQSEIRIGYLTDMKYDVNGDYYKSYLMNFPLGGAFNSRINLNLREDKGWTYGARAGFFADEEIGSFTASAGVKAVATDSSVVEFINEIKGYQKDGITNDELAFMKSSIGQRDARNYETPRQKAGFLRRIVHYDLDRSFVDEQTKIVENVTKKELDALAKKYLQPENMYILVVGDEKSIRPGLEKLGYEIIVLDASGEVKVAKP